MTFNTQHIFHVTATQNILTMSHNCTIEFSVPRTLYTRRRAPVTRITRPALAQTQTRPPHPRWDNASWYLVYSYFNTPYHFRLMWGGTWSLVGKPGPVWTWLSTLASICPGSSQGHSISEPALRSLTAPNLYSKFQILVKTKSSTRISELLKRTICQCFYHILFFSRFFQV